MVATVTAQSWAELCLYLLTLVFAATCAVLCRRWLRSGFSGPVLLFQAGIILFLVVRVMSYIFALIQFGVSPLQPSSHLTAVFIVLSSFGTSLFFLAKTLLLLSWTTIVRKFGEDNEEPASQSVFANRTFRAPFAIFVTIMSSLFGFAVLVAGVISAHECVATKPGCAFQPTLRWNMSLEAVVAIAGTASTFNAISFGIYGLRTVRVVREMVWRTVFNTEDANKATRKLAVVAGVVWLSFIARGIASIISLYTLVSRRGDFLITPTASGENFVDVPVAIFAEILPCIVIVLGLAITAHNSRSSRSHTHQRQHGQTGDSNGLVVPLVTDNGS